MIWQWLLNIFKKEHPPSEPAWAKNKICPKCDMDTMWMTQETTNQGYYYWDWATFTCSMCEHQEKVLLSHYTCGGYDGSV